MSLAQKLPDVPAPSTRPVRKGPVGACEVYGPGKVADFLAVEARRRQPNETWASVQQAVDAALGIDQPIKADHFRYHWRGKCAHWDGVDLP